MGQINVMEIHYSPSASEKLFMLFLFVAVCIVLVRMTRMAWHLWSIRRRQEFSSFERGDIEGIAKAALRGLFDRESRLSPSEETLNLSSIEANFLFLWETFQSRVQSTKTPAALTVVLSFSVTALGWLNICNGLMTEKNVGLVTIGIAGRDVFTLLAIGLFVSAFFYLLSIIFEGTLARRRRDWNYPKAGILKKLDSK